MSQLYSEPSPIPSQQELAYALLVLERQLNVYQRLHQEDLAALRSALEELKEQLLSLVASAGQKDPASSHGDAGASISFLHS